MYRRTLLAKTVHLVSSLEQVQFDVRPAERAAFLRKLEVSASHVRLANSLLAT